MFRLVVEDFEEANDLRGTPERYWRNKDTARFNYEWADLLKELFDG